MYFPLPYCFLLFYLFSANLRFLSYDAVIVIHLFDITCYLLLTNWRLPQDFILWFRPVLSQLHKDTAPCFATNSVALHRSEQTIGKLSFTYSQTVATTSVIILDRQLSRIPLFTPTKTLVRMFVYYCILV